jgi:hypothetical protein
VGVREMLLGVVVVGALAGMVLGRHTERMRRNYKDWGAAKSAVPKAKQLAFATIRTFVGRVVVWGAILVFAIVVFMKLPSSGS